MEKSIKKEKAKTKKETKETKLRQERRIGEKELESPSSEEKKEEASSSRYWEATGRRKTAVARVRLFTRGEKEIIVNDKKYDIHFPTVELQQDVLAPLLRMKNQEKFRVVAKVSGGGIRGQAEAMRHAIARALVTFNPDFKKRLKRAGFLKRDPRMKERKKFGFKSARRAPQWQKR